MKCFFYTYQEGLGAPFALYQMETPKGGLTTVTAGGLEERGITVPPTPSYAEWKRPEETIHLRNVGYMLAKTLLLFLLAVGLYTRDYQQGCGAGTEDAHYDYRHGAVYNQSRRFWRRNEWDRGYSECYRTTADDLVRRRLQVLRKLKVVM